jgi:Ca-activated chloride channel family protein
MPCRSPAHETDAGRLPPSVQDLRPADPSARSRKKRFGNGRQSNPYEKRVFTFGVGLDVNTPLLSRIAAETRAKPTSCSAIRMWRQNRRVFRSLSGPVLSDATSAAGQCGLAAPGRVREVLPVRLPDLFHGDQLVVLGHYLGEEQLTFKVDGRHFGREKTFRVAFDPDKATTKNSFVPRLWASRKIGVLIDEIRQAGADGDSLAPARQEELVSEIVKLSTEFGIMTEYTAFLALDGTDLTRPDENIRRTAATMRERAVRERSGMAAVNQELNSNAMAEQKVLTTANVYYNSRLEQVNVVNVRRLPIGLSSTATTAGSIRGSPANRRRQPRRGLWNSARRNS